MRKQDIENSKPGDVLRDPRVPGLELRVRQKRRSWSVRLGHERRRVTIGEYPAMSFEQAKRRAHELLAAPTPKSSALTVDALFERWTDAYGSRLASYRPTASVWRRRVSPVLGKRRADDVTRGELQRLVDGVDGRGAQRQLAQTLSAVWRWSYRRELVSANAAADLEKPAKVARSRALSLDELLRLLGHLDSPAREFFKLGVLLGGQRPQAIEGLRWDQLDLDAGVYLMPAEYSEAKKRTRSGEPREIPISTAATELLRGLPRHGSWLWASPVFGGSQPLSKDFWHGRLAAALRASGVRHATRHDVIRRTAATLLGDLGVRREVIERLQGREVPGVAGVYQRAQLWAEQVEATERLGAALSSTS